MTASVVPRRIRRRRAAGAATIVALAGLAAAPAAHAAPTPDRPSATVPAVTNASSATVAWLPVAPDADGNVVEYEVELNGEPRPRTAGTELELDPLPEGTLSVRVRSVEIAPDGTEAASGYSEALSLLVDRSDPGITPVPPPPSASGWYRGPVTVEFACDDSGSGVAFCSGPFTLSEDGANQSVPARAVDAAGNVTERRVGSFDIDGTAPLAPAPTSADITNQPRPTLRWRPSADATSGLAGYALVLDGGQPIPLPPGATALRVPAPLADGVYRWSIRATDVARNESRVAAASFEIDTTVPPPPAVDGPAELTRDRSPAFTWGSDLPGASFNWELRRVGESRPVAERSGTVALTETFAGLADGEYRFSVSQTNRAGTTGDIAPRIFTVDGTAPEAPAVTDGPPASGTDASPTFRWRAAEPGGAFQWQVMRGGEALDPPARTEQPEVQVGPLGPGSYTFRVRQVDAAGNVGAFATGDLFTVLGAPSGGGGGAAAVPPAAAGGAPGAAPRPRRTTTRRGTTVIRPPSLNARLLTPRAGIGFRALRPRLTWRGRPGAATLYNVQIFRMRGRTLVKVHSAFPTGGSYRVPRGVLRTGRTYVWRVWPYLGRRGYAKRPIGISWFRIRTGLRPR